MSGLTVADVFDLLAEHAECWCPPETDRCPKHQALRIVASAQTSTEIAVYPGMLPMDRLSGYSLWADGETPRVMIALLLWRIVAEFCHDAEPLRPGPGQTITIAAEQYVRSYSSAAEQEDAEYEGETEVIVYVLHRLGLDADYQRVKRDTQHMAFANPEETR